MARCKKHEFRYVEYVHTTKLFGFRVTHEPCHVEKCKLCDEVIFSTNQVERFEREAALALLVKPMVAHGETLRYARKALGLKQQELSELLGLDIIVLEKPNQELSMSLRLAMAALLAIHGKHVLMSTKKSQFPARI